MPIKHKKTATGQNNGQAGQVQPGDWNDNHDLTGLLALLDAVTPAASKILTINAAGQLELAPLSGLTADNVALTGVPTAPTPSTATNNQQVATTAFVKAVVAALINSAPGALDTLDELAAALGDDANFAATVNAAIAARATLASPAFTGTPTVPTAANTVKTTQAASMAAAYAITGARGQCVLKKSGANLVLSPVDGNLLTINGVNCTVPDAGVSLAPTGFTPSTNYYIYAVATSGVVTSLEASATVPVLDTTAGNKGVMIKTGDATRSLVGFARCITGPAWADTATQRFVRSWFKDQGVDLTGAYTLAGGIASASLTEAATAARVEFLCWSGERVDLTGSGTMTDSAGANSMGAAVGVDGNSVIGSICTQNNYTASARCAFNSRFVSRALSEGYHYASLYLQSISSTSATFNSGSGAMVNGTIGPRSGG